MEVFEEFGYDPAQAVLVKYGQLSLADQLKVDLRLMDFAYPKSKECEETVIPQVNPIEQMTPDERTQRLAELRLKRYRSSDKAVFEDLEAIAEIQPEILRQFISSLNEQSKIENK